MPRQVNVVTCDMVCGDGGGRSADENYDCCDHTLGHCDKNCFLIGGEDRCCNWCDCEPYYSCQGGIC